MSEDFLVLAAECERLLRLVDYMDRKAEKSPYWAKELELLRSPGGLVERLKARMAMAVK